MMTKPDKKYIERWELDRFCRLLELYPADAPVPGEEPDFTLPMGDGRTLGIELTELHRDVPPGTVPPQAHEALRWRIVQRAREIHDTSAALPLHVSVLFSGVDLTKTRVQFLAERIAGLVGTNIPPTGEARRLENDGLHDDFPEELHSIGIYNLPTATGSFFTSPGATWVATLRAEDVQRAVAAKEAKYVVYRKRADEVWLVVTCNGTVMSTWFESIERAESFPIETSFDRVFLLSHFGDRLVEVGRK